MLPEIKTILYATGLGPGAPHVFRYAIKEAEKHGARLVVLHVLEPLNPFGQHLVELHISHEQRQQIQDQARDHARAKIEERIRRLCEKEVCHATGGEDLVDDILVREGQPHLEIVACAREIKADLIIIGSHRHSALGESMLGHTANRVVHRSEIPVLLVRIPDGYHEAGF